MKKLFTFLTLLLVAVGISHADTTTKGSYSTKTVSDDGSKTIWEYNVVESSTTVESEAEENDVIYIVNKNNEKGKIQFKHTTSEFGLSVNGESSVYIPVPEDGEGTISMTTYSASDSRYFQLYIDGTAGSDSQRLWSKFNATDDGKKGPQTFNFTSSDLTTYNGKTYLHFKDNNTELKVSSFTLTLKNGGGETEEPETPAEVFKWYVDGSTVKQTVAKYFTLSSEDLNNKYKGKYDGITCTKGQKISSSTTITFNTEKKANVVIVQSLSDSGYSRNSIKLDGVEYTDRVDNPEGSETAGVYTIVVGPGSHTISRGSAEIGLFYISVTYVESSEVYLDAPVIKFNADNGEVTITADAQATKVMYTTDGTEPSAENGNEYSAPFTVEDGTVVKAIAIGDGGDIKDSQVATSDPCLLNNVTIETPVVTTFNGAVGISCATLNTKLEYRLDETADWVEYTRPFNVADGATATVYVRATRGNNEATANVEVKGMDVNTNKTRTVVMGYGSFNDPAKIDGYSTLVGKEGDDAFGYKLVLSGNADKAWSSGSDKIKISLLDNAERTTIKLSNGAQNTLVMPEGVKATRVYLYSNINAASGSRVSGWKEVNGKDYSKTYTETAQALGAWNNVADRKENPDLRVYDLGAEGVSEFTFTNAGEQLIFVIAVDVLDPQDDLKEPELSWSTESVEYKVRAELPEAPKFNNPAELPVTFASTNDEVAEVSETGVITLKNDKEGEAIVTATFAGDDTYAKAEASVKITVLTNVVKETVYDYTEGEVAVETMAWTAEKTSGTLSASTLVDDEVVTITTPYDAKYANYKGTYMGIEFKGSAQLGRVDADPTAENPTGTECTGSNAGNSPLVITPKKDITLVVYGRRQPQSKITQVDDEENNVITETTTVTLLANDGKSLNFVNQADVKTVLDNTVTFGKWFDSDKKDYAFVAVEIDLKAGETYTAFCRGTTYNIMGIGYNVAPEVGYVDVTIGSNGLATLSSEKALNVAGAEFVEGEKVEEEDVNFDVWTVKEIKVISDETRGTYGELQMEEVKGFIPAETGVIVHGHAGCTYRIPFATAEDAPASAPARAEGDGNLLKANLEEITHEADGEKFVLEGFNFVPCTAGDKLAAGTAYFESEDVPTAVKDSVLTPSTTNGPTTGVENVAVDGNADVEYYTIGGVKVAGELAPGLYIKRVNGETTKVIIR